MWLQFWKLSIWWAWLWLRIWYSKWSDQCYSDFCSCSSPGWRKTKATCSRSKCGQQAFAIYIFNQIKIIVPYLEQRIPISCHWCYHTFEKDRFRISNGKILHSHYTILNFITNFFFHQSWYGEWTAFYWICNFYLISRKNCIFRFLEEWDY